MDRDKEAERGIKLYAGRRGRERVRGRFNNFDIKWTNSWRKNILH